MDGLDRLIEMLEKRFGKFWADTLLVIVVFGAAALGIHAVFSYLLVPAVRIASDVIAAVRGGPLKIDKVSAITLGIQIVLYFGLAAAFNIYFRRARKNWQERARQDALGLKTILEDAKSYLETQSQLISSKFNELETARSSAKTELDALIHEAKEANEESRTSALALLDAAEEGVRNIFATARSFVERARAAGLEVPPELTFHVGEESSPQLPLDTEQEKQP
jgi:hypothetical protein